MTEEQIKLVVLKLLAGNGDILEIELLEEQAKMIIDLYSLALKIEQGLCNPELGFKFVDDKLLLVKVEL